MKTKPFVLEVHRTAIGRTRVVEQSLEPLDSGEVRFAIDRFGVTANNITYAVFGDALGYWDFFPTGDNEWGRVPAMGWATVIESQVEGIAEGTRYYGWYPMASHVTLRPTATDDGFRDDQEHRANHASVYRNFLSTSADPMYPGPAEGVDGSLEDGEDRHALLRGLALTGFLAEEFFADGGGAGEPYMGAATVVVLSASSKTGLGFADRAQRRNAENDGGDAIAVVGITSERNRAMVTETDLYDEVISYDEIDQLDTTGDAVSIDMAGNPTALAAVHEHFGDGLLHSMTVGRSHHDAEPPADRSLAGPKPQMFFAPTEVSRRNKQWGREVYAQRCAEAISSFTIASRGWLTVDQRAGSVGAEKAWADVHAGSVAPNSGVVVYP